MSSESAKDAKATVVVGIGVAGFAGHVSKVAYRCSRLTHHRRQCCLLRQSTHSQRLAPGLDESALDKQCTHWLVDPPTAIPLSCLSSIPTIVTVNVARLDTSQSTVVPGRGVSSGGRPTCTSVCVASVGRRDRSRVGDGRGGDEKGRRSRKESDNKGAAHGEEVSEELIGLETRALNAWRRGYKE